MRHDFLDRYSRQDSPVHRLSAEAKLVCVLAVIVLTVAAPLSALPYFAGLACVLATVALAAKIPMGYLGMRLLWMEPFVLGVGLLTLFQPGGWTIFTGIVVKSTLSLVTMVLLANTTPFAEILRVMKRARMPGLLVTTLALMYRYLFVLVDEAERMQRARLCRTFERRRWIGWKTLATVAGQLFVRSTERAERIYAAMLARGWK
ncbi:MAG: cobalt ECF transporter T component CbiQ [Verrucomicrobia bacterium]|nr:cobalt ECF transporter T component CbiQ [Verrucomicrobiota bacterium]